MDWRRIRHVPVEDSRHRLTGLVTYRSLLRALLARERASDPLISVGQAMIDDVETIAPDAPVEEALNKMMSLDIGCLPVVQGGQLVGMLSERDLMPLVRRAFEPAAPKGTATEELTRP